MIIKCFTAGQLENNIYLVIDEKTKKAVLIDASALIPEITEAVKAYGADVEYILLTHGHFDHIMGLTELKKVLNAKAVICHDDLIISDNINEFTRLFGGLSESVPPVYEKFVKDGDIVTVGDMQIKVIHTPGHTEGGVCYLIEDITSKFRNNVLNKLGVKVQSFSFKFLEVIITFIIVDLAWIFFRAETIHDAFYYIQRMFTKIDLWRLFDGSLYKLGLDNFEMNILIISLIVLFLVDLIKYIKKETIYEFLKNQCLYFRWAVIFFLLFFIIIYGKYGAGFDPKQFIYFQF